eukprot:2106048-Alexandrium_andersonii.AAC.1
MASASAKARTPATGRTAGPGGLSCPADRLAFWGGARGGPWRIRMAACSAGSCCRTFPWTPRG